MLKKVDKFIYFVGFIVLDMLEDEEISLILERPFLATGKTSINVHEGKIILRMEDEQETFDVFKSMNSPSEINACLTMNALENVVAENLK